MARVTDPAGLRPHDVAPHAPLVDPARFVGQATIHQIARALGTDQLRVNVLFFEAGARTRPHLHPYDQILFYAHGVGIVAQDGGEDQRVEPGEFALLPAGHVHMHGAADDGSAMHISMMGRPDNTVEPDRPFTSWDMSVPDSWRQWCT
jgi:quercetin dioxygenase-like cupin family protein